MDSERDIDLKRYIPRKASRAYFLRILFYVLFLCAILAFVWYKLYRAPANDDLPEEIRGVEIELE